MLGNFFNLFFLGEDDSPSERFSRELEDTEAVLSQFLVVLFEDSKYIITVLFNVCTFKGSPLPEYSDPELSDPTDSVFLCEYNLESEINSFSILIRADGGIT